MSHISSLISHISYIKNHTSYVIYHISFIIYHISYIVWNHSAGIMEEESWRSNHGEGIMENESWRMNHGGGVIDQDSWERIQEEVGNSQDPPRGTQKAHRRHPGGTQDAPNGRPGGSQKSPRRLPWASQVNQGSKRPLREGRVILYWLFKNLFYKSYLYLSLLGGGWTCIFSRRIFTSMNVDRQRQRSERAVKAP